MQFRRKTVWIFLILVLGICSKNTWAFSFEGVLVQGGFVNLKLLPNQKVYFKGKTLFASNQGELPIGFSRNDAKKQSLAIFGEGGKKKYHHFEIKTRKYDVQKINGLPKNKVTPDAKTSKKISEDNKKARAARKINREDSDYLSGFIWPVDSGIITGIYGSQRILNGKPKRPHYGVDVAAPKGTPMLAPAKGLVTLVEFMVLSGWTVMVDHGKGLRSTLIHLDSVDVKKGQRVNKGDLIGKVGMTGRATGPHVHWGMSWFNVRLDPVLAITSEFPIKKGMKIKGQVLSSAELAQ